MVIESISVSIAMYCLIQFYIQVKGDISQYRPFLKILAIKLVIFLSFWQTVSFMEDSCLRTVEPGAKQRKKNADSYLLPCILTCNQTQQESGVNGPQSWNPKPIDQH